MSNEYLKKLPEVEALGIPETGELGRQLAWKFDLVGFLKSLVKICEPMGETGSCVGAQLQALVDMAEGGELVYWGLDQDQMEDREAVLQGVWGWMQDQGLDDELVAGLRKWWDDGLIGEVGEEVLERFGGLEHEKYTYLWSRLVRADEEEKFEVTTVDQIMARTRRFPLLVLDEERYLTQLNYLGAKAGGVVADLGVQVGQVDEGLLTMVDWGERAEELLVESNMRLVMSIAKRYLGQGVKFEDLIQAGRLGLMKALKRFDPGRGVKVSTYATWWIRQTVGREVMAQGRSMKIPAGKEEKLWRLARLRRELYQELGVEPGVDELAGAAIMSGEEVMELLSIDDMFLSLDAQRGISDDSGGDTWGEFVEDSWSEGADPQRVVQMNLMKEEVVRSLAAHVNLKEREVLEWRYGLVDGEGKTFEEVAQLMGITRQRAFQLEKQGLRRIAESARAPKLRGYLR